MVKIFLRICCLLAPALLLATTTSSSAPASDAMQSPKATASEKERSTPMDLPLLVGQDIKGITIPQYDSDGHLTMRFSAERARKIDDHKVELDTLIIEFFQKDGKDITVSLPHGVFDLATKTLSSDDKVSLKREDFDVTGQSATFDTVKKFGTMQGHVHTEIRNSTPSDEL